MYRKTYFCVCEGQQEEMYLKHVVRRIYGLNREADIKERANLERILKQITLDDVKQAIRRADQIRAFHAEVDALSKWLIV